MKLIRNGRRAKSQQKKITKKSHKMKLKSTKTFKKTSARKNHFPETRAELAATFSRRDKKNRVDFAKNLKIYHFLEFFSEILKQYIELSN